MRKKFRFNEHKQSNLIKGVGYVVLPLERQNKILEILAKRQAVSVEELCTLLYSSGATIRRDLQVLENNSLLRRTHGGAVYIDGNAKDFPLTLRENENLIPKSIIAKKALPFIHDGQTLFLDASSTVCQLTLRLTGFQHLRVITNGLKTANILSEIEGVEVYGTGGRLRENAKSFVGPQAVEFVSRFTADLAFFSCRGVHPATGITDSSEDEASLKRMYMQNAKHTILLCDSSKLGKENFCKIGGLDAVWKILTNIQLPPDYETAGQGG